MYFHFECSHCGKSLKAREEHIGRRVACPYCKTHMAVPQPESFDSVASGTQREQQIVIHAGSDSGGTASGARTQASSPTQLVDGTNVSLLRSCGIGIGGTIALYVLVTPLYLINNYFGNLFIKTDASFWVPVATTFLMFWAVGMLYLKSRKLKRQRRSMLFDLLPYGTSAEINEENLEQFLKNIDELPGNAHESFLVNRVKRGLEHFGVRKSASEVATILSSQSEIDANAVESSYSILNVFIWAIPILGFIGTVIGIGAAVGGFSSTLEAAANIEGLKESLKGVTGGLGTAFDTTLVALVMSMVVMFPMSSLKKSEEDLLNWVDEYCNENLLKRLNDGREGSGDASGVNSIVLRKAINAALAPHHAELESWSQKLASSLDTWNKKLDADSDSWTRKLEAVGKTIAKQVVVNLQELNKQEKVLFDEKIGQLKAINELTSSVRQAAEALSNYCDGLNAGLSSLNQVLERLGQQQVIVPHVPASQPVEPVAELVDTVDTEEAALGSPTLNEPGADGEVSGRSISHPIIRESRTRAVKKRGWFFSRINGG